MAGLSSVISVILLICLVAGEANAGETGCTWRQSLEVLNSTTPFPLAPQADRDKGWSHGAWGGIKRIWSEGTSDLYLSGRYWHTPWGFTDEDRARYDDWGLGVGYGRSLTDEKGNQRLLYALVVQDSFEKPMYLTGYGWLAQTTIPWGLTAGAGYSIVIISNDTASDYIPFPAPAPMASLGSEKVSLYCTYFNSIFYLFAKVKF